MKALILAAGYGTRLARDIENDASGRYANLLGVPKPLLPIGGKPLISRWVEDLLALGIVDGIYVVTNAYNNSMFHTWRQQYDNNKVPVLLVSDGSTTNEDRSGAVAAIKLARDHFHVHDDMLVIGGDTLFLPDFDLKATVEAFMTQHRQHRHGSSMLLAYTTDDVGASKCGILETDKHNEVTAFLEKPGPKATTSRLACPCFYLLSSLALVELDNFMEVKKDRPLAERDAPGNFIRFLVSRLPCYVMPISGRYDVGGLQSYIDCDADFRKASATPTSTTGSGRTLPALSAVVALVALSAALRLLTPTL